MGNTASGFSKDIVFVKLEECEEEHDNVKREARFAFRCPYLHSVPYWTLVIHFLDGRKTYLFQTRKENGFLQAYRAEIHRDIEVFDRSMFFGTAEISPKELLAIAKQVPTGEFHILSNLTAWQKNFLDLVYPEELSTRLNRKYNEGKQERSEDIQRMENIMNPILITQIVAIAGVVGYMLGSRT